MKRLEYKYREYKPKEYKKLVARLLDENHELSRGEGLPKSFLRSIKGIDILNNFDNVFNSFLVEFPLVNIMNNENLIFTFKVLLEQQLDSFWYSDSKIYKTNLEIYNDHNLIYFKEVDPLFSYLEVRPGKEYVSKFKKILLGFMNSPLRNCSGMFLPYAPVQMYNFLNKLCMDLNESIVVTNTLRSLEYQNKLRAFGHITPGESSHLYGYTVDIEQLWYKENNKTLYGKIKSHLQYLEEEGQINYIDYGQIWHICLSPCFLDLYLY